MLDDAFFHERMCYRTNLPLLNRVSEVVPVKHRGYINGLMLVLSLLYGPYVLYGQLLASRATWRWGMWVSW